MSSLIWIQTMLGGGLLLQTVMTQMKCCMQHLIRVYTVKEKKVFSQKSNTFENHYLTSLYTHNGPSQEGVNSLHADNFCKQFEQKLFDTLIVFLKDIFQKC